MGKRHAKRTSTSGLSPASRGWVPPGQRVEGLGPSDTHTLKGNAPLPLCRLVCLLPGPHPHNRAARSHAHSRILASIPKSADVDLPWRRSDSVAQDTAALLLSPDSRRGGPRGNRSLQSLGPPVVLRLHGLSPSGLRLASSCFSDSVLSFPSVLGDALLHSVKPAHSSVGDDSGEPWWGQQHGQNAECLHQPSRLPHGKATQASSALTWATVDWLHQL